MARIDDGYQTKITFTDAPSGFTIILYEKSVTPPGIDMGGSVETTTMRNSTWRTFNPKSLKTLSEASFVGAYDPEVYNAILSLIGNNGQIEVEFPNGDTLTFWGWLDKFIPNELVEGEQPTAQVTIIPSNQNDSGTETAPVYAGA